jgi:V/A-type H+-transporting ATPase subunit D
MAKIKHTKNELKSQRDALARFERFLPMLLLKKQQLQAEIQQVDAQLSEREARSASGWTALRSWVRLLSEPVALDTMVSLEGARYEEGNIAGVRIPILAGVDLRSPAIDLAETPAWVDDAVEALGQLIHLRVERDTLSEQRRLIAEELRTTAQRVNLFEKVKIPECRENIRVIRIYLGDEQTAAVARGKIAKRRSEVAA